VKEIVIFIAASCHRLFSSRSFTYDVVKKNSDSFRYRCRGSHFPDERVMDATSENLLRSDKKVKGPLNFLQGQREILNATVNRCGCQVDFGCDFLQVFHYPRKILVKSLERQIQAFRHPPKLKKKRNRKTDQQQNGNTQDDQDSIRHSCHGFISLH
jgi:hypothetical protein